MNRLNIWILFFFTAIAAGAQTVDFSDNGKAIINPQMGWTMHFYSNNLTNYGSKLAASDTLDDFPGLSVIYLRLPWCYLEPVEGQFEFSVFDTPAQKWIDKGKKIAIRVSSSELNLKYATPRWVKKAGANGYFHNFKACVDPNGKLWEPDYGDPIFLEKLENFIKAMAARYDGNPNVAFIDIGSFGAWGEGHTHMTAGKEYGFEVKKKHIDLYVKYFKNTLLCISDDFVGHDAPGDSFPISDYAFNKGVTIRDDSICVQPPPKHWHHNGMAQKFWPEMPVILEHQHYGMSVENNAWGDGSRLLKSIEDYHASYMSIHWWPREFLKANREIIKKINRRMGYRIMPNKITLPEKNSLDDVLEMEGNWINIGVAPCYPGGFISLTLKDNRGGIAAVLVDESFNVRTLGVAPPGKAVAKQVKSSFRFAPNALAGKYDAYISVGQRDGTPVIAMPIDGDDGHKRYYVGKINVSK